MLWLSSHRGGKCFFQWCWLRKYFSHSFLFQIDNLKFEASHDKWSWEKNEGLVKDRNNFSSLRQYSPHSGVSQNKCNDKQPEEPWNITHLRFSWESETGRSTASSNTQQTWKSSDFSLFWDLVWVSRNSREPMTAANVELLIKFKVPLLCIFECYISFHV